MHQSTTEKHLFSKQWMDAFENIWNSKANSSSQQVLSGVGEVCFVIMIEDEIVRGTSVTWEKDGKMWHTPLLNPKARYPSFIAPPNVWESVIYSYYTTIQAVVNRKMEFEGQMKFAINFSKRFQTIAEVAIMVNQQFMRR